MSEMNEDMKLEEFYKKLVSKMIVKVYTAQQQKIDKLNIEIIQLKKMLNEKQYNQDINLFTDKIIGKSFKLNHSDSDDSE